MAPRASAREWALRRPAQRRRVGAGQIDLLLQHARRAGLTLASCNDVYRRLVAEPQLAHPAPTFPTAASA